MAEAQFLEHIKDQTEDQKPKEVPELEFDDIEIGSLTAKMKKELEKYTGLQFLSFNGCGLTSLDNFPNLPNLEQLSLDGNQLTGKALSALASLKNLKVLTLIENQIKDANELKPLASLPLEHIELAENEIAKTDGYRAKVFEVIKTLEVVDGFDKEGNEVQDDLEGGEDDDDDGEEYEEERKLVRD
eukprot:TRINITY_DN2950_c0_g1_i2.p1 TRINITY_DN2950_c0_g1~~TRINITY_DN2950_c0_g1_i2.p1  ORF type:complete len:186 (+),score=74.53 TRINITY_DN2950_c0_g1_i2:149-706(+)